METATLTAGVTKKRNRIPISCEFCRVRKLKCDRQKPCQNCSTRNLQSSCSYSNDDSKSSRPSRTTSKAVPGPNSDDMTLRLKRLESLVHELAATKQSDGKTMPENVPRPIDKPHPDDDQKPLPAYGSLVATPLGPQYISIGHWEAALNDIAALKEHLEAKIEPQDSSSSDSSHPGLPSNQSSEDNSNIIDRSWAPQCRLALLGGVSAAVDKAELLDAFPAKDVADRLIAHFLESYEPAVPAQHMVHKPTFVRQYKHFWEDPESVSLTRLALLFTVCCLSMQDYDRNGNEPTDLQNQTSRLSDNYLDRAAQCILLSEITAPHPDSIQCLILYGMAEAYRVRNGLSIWMFQGILIRKAMHMGYHRDPDTFPSISPFDREMRRRLWHSISQLEQLLSFQLGLPPMIQMSATDVAPPKNLFEEDLWEDMSSCPPSRPLSQATPVSYMICKHLAFRAFGKVVLYLSCTNAQNYSRVLELNQELADSYSAIPTYLKRKPWEESLGDPRWLRLQRMQLEMNYCKAFCVLNRRYIAIPKGSTQPLPSRALCIQSALNLLAIQTNMRQEGSKWHAFSFCCHDFLLATIIASLVLHTSTAETQEALNSENLKLWSALETSRRNWEEVRDISPEARNACRVIDTVYENLRPPPAEPPNESVPVIKNDGPQTSFAPGLELSFVPAWVGDESLGPNSGFDWTSWDSVMQGNDFDTFNNLWQV